MRRQQIANRGGRNCEDEIVCLIKEEENEFHFLKPNHNPSNPCS